MIAAYGLEFHYMMLQTSTTYFLLTNQGLYALFVYHIWFLGYIKINIFALGCDQCSEKIKRMWKSVLPRC